MLGILAKPTEQRQQQRRASVGQHTIVSAEAKLGLLPMCADPLGEAFDSVQMGMQKFKIRLTRDEHHAQSANLLIRRMYSWRGYTTAAAPVAHTTNKICLSVFFGEQTIGTLTVGLDSADGLSADNMYQDRIDPLRKAGHILCEMTKLAVDPNVRSRKVLSSLFHIAYIHARYLSGCTDILAEVNPRHVAFYERMLGFHSLGEERHCERVNAPAVLMRVETAFMDAQVRKFGGQADAFKSEKSIYPYFFSKADEVGIAQRLLENHQ